MRIVGLFWALGDGFEGKSVENWTNYRDYISIICLRNYHF
jgi:hypothetical protein